MKQSILTIFFTALTLFCFSQNIVKDSILNIGFYANLHELTDNNPSKPFHYEISEREIYVAKSAFKNDKVKIYNLIIEKDSTKSIGDIIGFSDGKNIYLKTGATGTFANYKGNTFGIKSNFLKIPQIGVYTYFSNIENMKYGGGGLAGSLSIGNTSIEYIINLKTTEMVRLTNKIMKELLIDEPDLLKEFDADKNRKKNYEKYVVEYNRRYRAKN